MQLSDKIDAWLRIFWRAFRSYLGGFVNTFPTSDEKIMAALAHGSIFFAFLGPIAPVAIWAAQRQTIKICSLSRPASHGLSGSHVLALDRSDDPDRGPDHVPGIPIKYVHDGRFSKYSGGSIACSIFYVHSHIRYDGTIFPGRDYRCSILFVGARVPLSNPGNTGRKVSG